MILSAAALTLLFAACKKDDDKSTTAKSNWKIGNTSYSAMTTIYLMENLTGIDANGNSFRATFETTPVSGTYKIIGFGSPEADEVMIAASRTSDTTTFFPTDFVNQSATVTVNNNKITVEVPTIWAQDFLSDDSVQISGKLVQD